MGFVFRMPDVFRGPFHFHMVLNNYTVVNDGYPCLFIDSTVGLESWRRPDDIVAVPIAWLLNGVYQRDVLLIDTGGLSVHIGLVIVHIKYLNFVQSLHKYSTVSAALTFAFDDKRAPPLDMELKAFEMLAGFNISLTRFYRHCTLFNGPSGCLIRTGLLPGRQGSSVKQYNSIGRNSFGVGCDFFGDRRPNFGVFWFHFFLLSDGLKG